MISYKKLKVNDPDPSNEIHIIVYMIHFSRMTT